MTHRPLPRLSLALRIAIASALFGFVIIAIGIWVGYRALAQQLDQRSLAELGGKRDLLVHVISELPSVAAIGGNRHRFADLLIGHDDVHLALLDAGSGAPLASFSPIASESVRVLEEAATRTPVAWESASGGSYIGLRGEAAASSGERVRFYLALDRRHDLRLLSGFVQASLLGLPLLLTAVAVGAWLIATTGLAPLRRFGRLAATIGAQSLGQRLTDERI